MAGGLCEMRKAMKDGCPQRTLTPCESWSAESYLFGMFVLGPQSVSYVCTGTTIYLKCSCQL